MTRDEEILGILKKLSEAYPGLKVEKGMIEAYLENLRDVPAWLLKKAVKRQIESSQWFPKVAELRQTARALAGTSNFSSLDPNSPDPLFRELLKLEADFYQQDRLEAKEWEWLAERFEQEGRPHMAEATREKLRGRNQLLVGRLIRTAQYLEDDFFNEGRLEPAEWEGLALEFERRDRPHRAASTREKLRHLQLIISARLSPQFEPSPEQTSSAQSVNEFR